MQASKVNVVRADASDADKLTDVLSVAFQEDPVSKWLFPDDVERERINPLFFRPFVDMTLEEGEIYTTDDRVAAALWLPVDVAEHADPPDLGELFAPILGPVYAARVAAFDKRSTANHPTHASHYYLPFIGVQPDQHGHGIGAALLRDRLTALDEQGVPAYLEASSLDSARLYERLGFRRLGQTTDIPGAPSLYPMWRDPEANSPSTARQ
ncbi:MAG TPA: GNAT family N-acetyltransferase [Trebonia sp.]|nr:GNAT family N-acetyltransferase [Trebonia sp.]